MNVSPANRFLTAVQIKFKFVLAVEHVEFEVSNVVVGTFKIATRAPSGRPRAKSNLRMSAEITGQVSRHN